METLTNQHEKKRQAGFNMKGCKYSVLSFGQTGYSCAIFFIL
jgi:hypothetical protein